MDNNALVHAFREAAVALAANAEQGANYQIAREALLARGVEIADDLASLLNDPDLWVSECAAEVLGEIGSERAIDRVVEYSLLHLADPTGLSRERGPGWGRLLALGKAALPAMTRAYSQAPNETKLLMIHLVQYMGDPAGKPILDQALAEADGVRARAAAEALGSLGDPTVYQRLVELLKSGGVQQRCGAIAGLRRLGMVAAVEPLLEVLEGEDEVVPVSGPSPGAVRETVHDAAATAIAELTGQWFGKDVRRIRDWINSNQEAKGSGLNI